MQQWGHSLNHKDTELETRAFLFHVSNLEYACGSNLRHVSARSWDHNDRYDQFAGEHCLLVDGFQTLLTKLADGLDIKFGTCVKSIEYGQVHDINVTTSNDDTYLADKVIVTLPLRQLKDGVVKFTPPLPQEKLDAIEKLGAGKLEKIALRFKLNFWSEKVKSADFFGHVPASELDRGWFGVFYDLSPKETEVSFGRMIDTEKRYRY
jgi:lysine-specific histone demethylase 1B